jgi:hypothetical protein
VTGEKRVHITLDGAHAMVEKTSAPAKASNDQDDASTTAQKHGSGEMGA